MLVRVISEYYRRVPYNAVVVAVYDVVLVVLVSAIIAVAAVVVIVIDVAVTVVVVVVVVCCLSYTQGNFSIILMTSIFILFGS